MFVLKGSPYRFSFLFCCNFWFRTTASMVLFLHHGLAPPCLLTAGGWHGWRDGSGLAMAGSSAPATDLVCHGSSRWRGCWPAGRILALHGRISRPCSGSGGCRSGSTRTCRWRRRMAGWRGRFVTAVVGVMGGSMEVASGALLSSWDVRRHVEEFWAPAGPQRRVYPYGAGARGSLRGFLCRAPGCYTATAVPGVAPAPGVRHHTLGVPAAGAVQVVPPPSIRGGLVTG
jgi:hypothetical protein